MFFIYIYIHRFIDDDDYDDTLLDLMVAFSVKNW
jgi:hypothetical protein